MLMIYYSLRSLFTNVSISIVISTPPAPTCLQVHRSVSFSPLTLPYNRSLRIYLTIWQRISAMDLPDTGDYNSREGLLSVVKE